MFRPETRLIRHARTPEGTTHVHKHPVIAVTGSSGAGTTTVMKSFAHIFRREGIKAAGDRGRFFHRFDRVEMRERVRAADRARARQSAISAPRRTCSSELAATFADYGATGSGKVRRYIHDEAEAKELGGEPGTFTAWQPMIERQRPAVLRGPARRLMVADESTSRSTWICWSASCRSSTWSGSRSCTATSNMRGYSQEAVVDTILRRMPDYVNHICPQFSRTHVNFQRVPTVDTSNPFIAQDIPTADESLVVIRFANPKGIDFPYLLSMLHDSWMSRPNTIVVPGGKMGLAMQLIFTPMILRLMDLKKRALRNEARS